jgi:hypothetical protein
MKLLRLRIGLLIVLFFLLADISVGQNSSAVSLPDCPNPGEASYFTAEQISACYNSSSDAITVELKDRKNPSDTYRVELYSVLGMSVYDKSFSKSPLIEIPARNLKKGMYVIVISDDKNTVKKRILVN